jgi:putative membrane protein
MVLRSLFAFVHFLAAFGIFATVFLEWQTMSRTPTHAEARRIQLSDRWFGLFALVVLIVGALRVFFFEKGASYYAASPFFHAKMALFVLVGLLSIYPTVRFIKWGRQTKQGLPPLLSPVEYRRIMLMLRAELVLLLGVALCASLMARGVGM